MSSVAGGEVSEKDEEVKDDVGSSFVEEEGWTSSMDDARLGLVGGGRVLGV
jgi:hypothetical protein